jgi:FkbM family methyltransferase
MTVPRPLRRAAHVMRETAALPHKGRTIPRWIAFELLRAVSPVVAVDGGGGLRYYVSTRDRSVGRTVFMLGGYEPEVIVAVVRALEQEYGVGYLRGRTVVDVGANIGTSVIPLVAEHGAARGLALEPEAGNHALLVANVVANELAARITCRQVAASDHRGTAQLELSPGNSGDHRIRTAPARPGGAYAEERRRTTDVDVLPLDDVLEEEGIAPAEVALLWVDTQGHEAQVLAGAAGLLTAGVPACIEYWPYGLRRAGGLELLHRLIAEHFTAVLDLRDAGSGAPTRLAASDVARLAERYPAERYTDLLLLPG